MSYKWRPSKTQRREFAIRMQDQVEKEAYNQRQKEKADKRRSGSRFDYKSAGGNYIPTKAQHDFCFSHSDMFETIDEQAARNDILFGYSNREKCHHDQIHIVNEKIRRFESQKLVV